MKRQQMQRKPPPEGLSPFEVAVFACQALDLQERLAIIKWLGIEVGVPLYTDADLKKLKEKRSPILSLRDAWDV